MSFVPGSTRMQELTLTNPASALTDFSYVIGLPNLGADLLADVVTNGGNLWASNEANERLPLYVHGGKTGIAIVKFSPASSGTQKIRIWAAPAG